MSVLAWVVALAGWGCAPWTLRGWRRSTDAWLAICRDWEKIARIERVAADTWQATARLLVSAWRAERAKRRNDGEEWKA